MYEQRNSNISNIYIVIKNNEEINGKGEIYIT